MARQFPKSDKETCEVRARKSIQAETSRVSRDKNKFMRMRLDEDNEKLKSMLRERIERLVNVECFVNELLVKNDQPSIDWQNVWEDDACQNFFDSDDNENDDFTNSKLPNAADQASIMTSDLYGEDQCMIDSDEGTVSDNENLTIYEIHGEDIDSGEEMTQIDASRSKYE